MCRWFIGPLLVLMLLPNPGFASLPDTIDNIRDAVVGIGTYDRLASPRAQIAGTGFVIAPNLVATNAHVVDRDDPLNDPLKEHQLVVLVGHARQAKAIPAELVANDVRHDLAILRVKDIRFDNIMQLSTRKVREGELYAFTGFPIGAVLGLHPVTHRGIISAISPIVIPARTAKDLNAAQLAQMRNPYQIYQLDATAYPGNSGSPLYHPDTGEVVAVINKVLVKTTREAVLKDPSAITYAIPVEHLIKLMKQAN